MDARTQEFVEYVQGGGQVETGDWMPDEYRAKLIKFIEMHGNSELMGVLPEREWILRAPTLQRKLALTAKVQDEVGHSQLIYRVVEDLGKPRAALPPRPRRRQVEVPQRLPLPDEDVGRRRRDRVARRRGGDHLAEGAAQVLVRAVRADHEEDLLGGVVPHPPRARRDPHADERHGRAARARAGGARPVVGPADDVPRQRRSPPTRTRCSTGGSSRRANEEARQQFLDGYVPQIWELGLTVPDPKLRKNDEGVWEYSEPDWDELKRVVTGHGPMTAERLEFRRRFLEQEAWVRDVVLAEAGVIFEVFRQERRGQAFAHAGSIDGARRRVRGGVGARAVRPAAGVGGAVGRPARGDPRGARLPGRAEQDVPPRRRLLVEGQAEGSA